MALRRQVGWMLAAGLAVALPVRALVDNPKATNLAPTPPPAGNSSGSPTNPPDARTMGKVRFCMEEQKCSIGLPDGWSTDRVTDPGFFHASDADHTRTITLSAHSTNRPAAPVPANSQATVTPAGTDDLQDAKWEVSNLTATNGDGPRYGFRYVTSANGFRYELTLSSTTPDPRHDAVLAAILQSFRFSGTQPGQLALTIPPGWKSKLGATAGDPDRLMSPHESEEVDIDRLSAGDVTSLNDNSDYIRSFVQAASDDGAQVVQRQLQTVNGISFYVLSLTRPDNGATLNSMVWLTVHDGEIFQYSFYRWNDDPARSSDYMAVIRSIRTGAGSG